MQAAENMVLGQTQKGGPAAVMQSAASVNERVGAVGHREATDIARNKGATGPLLKTKYFLSSHNFSSSSFFTPPTKWTLRSLGNVLNRDSITIGEALEATALSCGDKLVDQGDAVAIQAAEMRATGTNEITPGGVASMAHLLLILTLNLIMHDENKTTLCDVLADSTTRLPMDKAMTREDAEGVIGAKIRNKLDMSTTPSGVAASSQD
ncbi:hypothetical protein SO802_033746 [Lithocarpus litseifolius]|uniref:SMP domain-containing protein n=1 Tax=Lithocarpus litseifolius TaxID=425828 RepID=A0AAW2BFX2_9ROSI